METEINNTQAIGFRNVSISFDERPVLSDISFQLERGEMIFITGVAGSGKSVLLHLAMASNALTPAKYWLKGIDVTSCSEVEAQRREKQNGADYGSTPLPISFLLFVVIATGTYLLLVEAVKRRLMRTLVQ
jgi:ABC-type transporter Mla maintaining outer membrane lipid asymmetry ATPase subunit MlaF